MTKKIVILGAGFAGISTAIQLARRLRSCDDAEIVIIDQKSEHTYTPLLYEVVSGGLRECVKPGVLAKGSAFSLSIQGRLIDHPRVSSFQGRITQIDLVKKKVRLQSNKKIPYDYLVVALGADVNTFGTPGVEKYGHTIKSIDDAVSINERICDLIHKSACGELTSVNMTIAGGGPTGVETASELAQALRRAEKVGALSCPWNVTIIDAGDRLLSTMSLAVSRRATKRLLKLGVEVVSGTLVKEVGESWVVVGPNKRLEKRISLYTRDASIESDVLIWTAGICVNAACSKWGFPTSERGYVHTDDTLRVIGLDSVFAIGDMATIKDIDIPQIASEAVSQGKRVAENIARLLHDKSPLRRYHSIIWPWAIPMGGKWAIANYRFVTLYGFCGYIFRKIVDLKYFMSILKPTHAIRIWWHGARVYMQND
jgi:NADH:ubiquinone reductase (H+-translocating)